MRAGLRSRRGLDGEKERVSSASALISVLILGELLGMVRAVFRTGVEFVEPRLRFSVFGIASSMSGEAVLLSDGSALSWSKEDRVVRLGVPLAAAMAFAVSLDIFEVLILLQILDVELWY